MNKICKNAKIRPLMLKCASYLDKESKVLVGSMDRKAEIRWRPRGMVGLRFCFAMAGTEVLTV